jgi:4-hydroxybenzoate polyprenyltransferase
MLKVLGRELQRVGRRHGLGAGHAISCMSTDAKGGKEEAGAKLRGFVELARLDKPIGVYLLLAPCYWSIALGANYVNNYQSGLDFFTDFHNLDMLASFTVGAVVMRSAGCIINDLFDRDIDKKVDRTKDRPIASGVISVPEAIGFLGVNLLAGLGVLAHINDYNTFMVGAASLPFVATYPLAKRFFSFPQLVLGYTFNWGCFLGFQAMMNDGRNILFDNEAMNIAVPLYIGCISWTIFYDTIYAYQDIEDDKKINVNSSAIFIGKNRFTKPILGLFGAYFISCATAVGVKADLSSMYYLGLYGIVTPHLFWQLKTLDLENSNDLANKFKSNKYIGLGMFTSILAGF